MNYGTKIILSIFLLTVVIFGFHLLVLFNFDGIPYNRDFPQAKYPYAKSPDGCSSPINSSVLKNEWNSVNFKLVCDQHDRCYYTLGANRQNCDRNFCLGLKEACVTGLTPVIDLGMLGTYRLNPNSNRLKQCKSTTNAMCAVVSAKGQTYFNQAQNLQKKYEDWAASVGKSSPK